jgi:hypothetical protein
MSDCQHPRSEVRRRVASNGVVAYWRQCLVCFQVVGTAVKHCDAPKDAAPFDEAARQRYWDQWHAQHDSTFAELRAAREAARQQSEAEWWERYNEYLESPEWRRKLALVLERDYRRCQARLDGCSIYATQVHHLSYKHHFNEPLFELVAICQSCHEQLHPDE